MGNNPCFDREREISNESGKGEMDKMIREQLIQKGKDFGFTDVKIISAAPFPEWEKALNRRKEIDPSSADSWDARGITADPHKVMEEARIIIIGILSYEPFGEFPEGYASYSSYYIASNKGYHMIKKLAAYLEENGCRAIANPPLPAKAAAKRAGVGYFGKNGILHNNQYGSYMSLHMLLSDAEIPVEGTTDSLREDISDCGSCRKCMDACPTGAIREEGTVCLSRCVRNYMGSGGVVPEEIREKMGTRMLGCDICQNVCPWNRKKEAGKKQLSSENIEPFSILAFLTESGATLKQRLKKIEDLAGKNYARAQRLISMAAIAAGNTGDPRYIPGLALTLRHQHSPIRIHSAWALGKMKTKESQFILSEALALEKDPEVKEAIEKALRSL